MTGFRRLPIVAQDAIVAVVVLVVGWVTITVAQDAGWLPVWVRSYTGVLWATCLVLAAWRWRPRVTFVVTVVGYPVVLVAPLVSEAQFVPLALACYGVTRAGRAPLWVAMAGGTASAVVLRRTDGRLSQLYRDTWASPRAQLRSMWSERLELSTLAFTVPMLCVCALFGWMVHRLETQQAALTERNAELERMRNVEAQRAAEAERTRIARELHDVVAHHVAAIAVRAQAAHRVADRDPAAVADAVAWIGTEAKDTLASMRQALRVLRSQDDPAQHAPAGSFDELHVVVARMRDAGLAVQMELADDLVLTPVVALAVTRIVQESLTNVLIHSTAREATVAITATDDAVQVEVTDPGPRAHDDGEASGGNGIGNMRERARAAHGTFEAGPHGTGWKVQAWLAT
ncbi:MAG: histidine kinase [Micrococcales bacterium]|nr:histidine kinase [Micrococcales bacterium]